MGILHSILALALLLMTVATHPAHAAPGRDSCRGYIDSLPASIGAEGTWCLRGHKYTSQTSGAAITVLADNVTIDCNHFRLSGLGAGAATQGRGVVTKLARTTLRNCRIQGFYFGVSADGAGHLIENNRFELNTYIGISVFGDHVVIRRNEVVATGGSSQGVTSAIGILADGNLGVRIADNTVHGVKPRVNEAGDAYPWGISGTGLIEDNHVSGLDNGSNGVARGIFARGRSVVRNNTVMETSYARGWGIEGSGVDFTICRDNDVILYVTFFANCRLAGTNLYTGPIDS